MAKEKVDHFKNAIKAYLDTYAADNSDFKIKYENHKKNIADCLTYIYNEVKKAGRQGFVEAEIYGMALHYYDEENIKVGNSVSYKVVVNHEVQLTSEEIEKARKKGLDKAKEAALAKIEEEAKNSIELSDEEKVAINEKAREKAVENAIEQKKQSLTKKAAKQKAALANNEPSLFD